MLIRSLLFPVLFLGALRAEIIDRIAVSIDNQVITESEILMQLRLAAFLNSEPFDSSPSAKRQAAERLIDQKLMRKEMDAGHYLQPADNEVQAVLKQVQQQRFSDQKDYQEALRTYSITEQDLKKYLGWQLAFLRFMDVRFRPGIGVSDDEIQARFNKERPHLHKEAGADNTDSLTDFRDRIEENLIERQVDEQASEWLAAARKRARIEFRPEAFQ